MQSFSTSPTTIPKKDIAKKLLRLMIKVKYIQHEFHTPLKNCEAYLAEFILMVKSLKKMSNETN